MHTHWYKYLNKQRIFRYSFLIIGAALIFYQWRTQNWNFSNALPEFSLWPFLGTLALIFPNQLAEVWRWNTAKKIIQPHTPQFRQSLKEVLGGQFVSFIAPGRMGQFIGRIAFQNPELNKWQLTKASFLCSMYSTITLIGLGLLAFGIQPLSLGLFGFVFPIPAKLRMHAQLGLLTILRVAIFGLQWSLLIGLDQINSVFQYLGTLTFAGWAPFGNMFVRENLALLFFQHNLPEQIVLSSLVLWTINLLTPACFGYFFLFRSFPFSRRLFVTSDLAQAEASSEQSHS